MKKLFIPILVLLLLFSCSDKQTLELSSQAAGADSRMFGGNTNANLDYGFAFTENALVEPTDVLSGRVLVEWPTSRVMLYSDGPLYFAWSVLDTSTDAIDPLTSLKVPGMRLVTFTVPWGLTVSNDDTLYLHLRAVVESSTATVRNVTL